MSLRNHLPLLVACVSLVAASPAMLIVRLLGIAKIPWLIVAMPWAVIVGFAVWLLYLLSHVTKG